MAMSSQIPDMDFAILPDTRQQDRYEVSRYAEPVNIRKAKLCIIITTLLYLVCTHVLDPACHRRDGAWLQCCCSSC